MCRRSKKPKKVWLVERYMALICTLGKPATPRMVFERAQKAKVGWF
jgi:hypothetical protein